jgi:hypothetical protein
MCSADGFAQNWLPISEEQFLGNKAVYTLLADTTMDGLYVGGKFDGIGNNTELRSIALWRDGQWNALGNGLTSYQFPASLRDMVIYNGDLYVGGFLTDADGVVCNGIARWDGVQWSALGGGVTHSDGNPGQVWGMRVIDDELYVCGRFVVAGGGLTVNGLAKWNGTSWSDVQNFPFFDAEGDVIHDCIIYNDELYVVGDFNGGVANGMLGIVKWNGNEWVGVGEVGTGQAVCMTVYQDKLYVAGYFTSEMNPIYPGRHIASWNGNSWDDVGGGLGNPNGPVYDMIVHDDKLYAVGSFITAGGTPAQFIATWDGNEWCDLGTVASGGLLAVESFQDTIYVGSGPVSLNGSELSSVSKLAGPVENENCGTLASVHDLSTQWHEVEVYPNPTTTTTTLTWSVGHHGNWQLQLYDVHGRQIAPPVLPKGEGKWEIDMSAFAKGIYFGRLAVGEEMRSFKVVRE